MFYEQISYFSNYTMCNFWEYIFLLYLPISKIDRVLHNVYIAFKVQIHIKQRELFIPLLHLIHTLAHYYSVLQTKARPRFSQQALARIN